MSEATDPHKPSDYKDRYEKLQLTLEDGTTPNVSVNRYRLDPWFFNSAGRTAFMRKFEQVGLDMELVVNTGTLTERVTKKSAKEKSGFTEWNRLLSNVFYGKGSPEACQIVLQLADHWGLAPNLPKYAEDYLGLDCNGFVGNYLWHFWNGGDQKPWTDHGYVEGQIGPSAGISGYLDHRTQIFDWNKIDTSKSYIFGRTGVHKTVIDRNEAGVIGHVVITEPGAREDITLPDGSTTFAVKTVESTGTNMPNPGLSFHMYKLKDPTATKPAHGIFEIDRGPYISGGPDHQFVKFKIVETELPVKKK